jgi:hypothetical protein
VPSRLFWPCSHIHIQASVDGSEDVEYEALDVDRRIRKFVSGREIGAVRRDLLKDIINAARNDFQTSREPVARKFLGACVLELTQMISLDQPVELATQSLIARIHFLKCHIREIHSLASDLGMPILLYGSTNTWP